jgi:hypothetical protein
MTYTIITDINHRKVHISSGKHDGSENLTHQNTIRLEARNGSPSLDYACAITSIGNEVRTVSRQHGRPQGVVMLVEGPINYLDGGHVVKCSSFDFWEGSFPATDLGIEVGYPTWAISTIEAAAFAEHAFGVATQDKTFAFLWCARDTWLCVFGPDVLWLEHIGQIKYDLPANTDADHVPSDQHDIHLPNKRFVTLTPHEMKVFAFEPLYVWTRDIAARLPVNHIVWGGPMAGLLSSSFNVGTMGSNGRTVKVSFSTVSRSWVPAGALFAEPARCFGRELVRT